MDKLQFAIILMRFAFETCEPLGFGDDPETVFNVLEKAIHADMLDAIERARKNEAFDRPGGGPLEAIFESRPELFAGVPPEILATGLDPKDSPELSSSPCPSCPPNDANTSPVPLCPAATDPTSRDNFTDGNRCEPQPNPH